MSHNNILIVIGSPKNENSNSDKISKYLEKELGANNLNYSKLYLSKELNNTENLIKQISKPDILIFILPVFENSASGNVLRFFETLLINKEKLLVTDKKIFAITNSGYADIKSNETTLTTCRLFAEKMSFTWLGGIAAAPGTLIEGENLGKMYNKLASALTNLSNDICNNEQISINVLSNWKPFISPILYRLVGRLYFRKNIKTLGKDTFYSKPLGI